MSSAVQLPSPLSSLFSLKVNLLFQDLLHLLSTLSVNFPEGKGSWTDCSFRLRNVVMTG
eukprot:m.121529 g.121529  ORF g.121529 m.121529 type:complete len:59 (+) comp15523_c6_seq1:80-256(+)